MKYYSNFFAPFPVRLFAHLLAVLLTTSAHAIDPAIRLERSGDTFVVRISSAAPHDVAVSVDSGSADLPPLLGTLSSDGEDRLFRPRFPFQPGMSYRVTIASTPPAVLKFSVPAQVKSSARITAVFPSGSVLPENQLKFYIHFSQAMARGDAYRWIALLDERGEKIAVPFLELGEELWDADNRRLTLFFDPGRVKSDLLPGREMGAPLRAGRSYTLQIDRAWPDASGGTLAAPFQKFFRVGAADHASPDPKLWQLRPPRAGTSEPLIVEFPEALDHALLFRMLDVLDDRGQALSGSVAVDQNETRWRFTPVKPWQASGYSLRAQTALEDLAGNKLNRPFEFEGTRTPEQRSSVESILISFEIAKK